MSGQRVILCEKRIKWYLPFWNTEITLSLQSLFVNDFFSRQSGNICEQHDFQICFKIFTNMATIHGKPLMSLRVVDLKVELEKRGLSTSGAKGVLVQRLEEYILEEEETERQMTPSRGDDLDNNTETHEFREDQIAAESSDNSDDEDERYIYIPKIFKIMVGTINVYYTRRAEPVRF